MVMLKQRVEALQGRARASMVNEHTICTLPAVFQRQPKGVSNEKTDEASNGH